MGLSKLPGLGSAMVGRVHETDALRYQLKAALDGTTRVAFLAGEPGIGKSRLLDWIEAEAEGRGATVLRGAAFQAEGMPPYSCGGAPGFLPRDTAHIKQS